MDCPISRWNQTITKKYLQITSENQFFERKGLGECGIKPTKIADELIGMLNAQGGVLVFGVSDTGEIQDLRCLGNKLDDYRRLVFDFIVFPCPVRLEEVELEGKLIFLYHVPLDWNHLYCRKDNQKVFLRVADSNMELNWAQIKQLEYSRNLRRFEDEMVVDFDPADLDHQLLSQYKQAMNFERGDVLDLLYSRHLVERKDGKILFKKSAILLFARNPEHYISSSSVRYIRYANRRADSEKGNRIVQDRWFEDNIPSLINTLRNVLRAELCRECVCETAEQCLYPEDAWLEGIVNALCHRSYFTHGNAVYIRHFDDCLEICNSGPLHAPVTVENMKTERFSRNPRIARVLEDFKFVRQLNEGVSQIYRAMARAKLAEPEYCAQNGNVCLILKRGMI